MKRLLLALSLWLAIGAAWADGISVPGIPQIGQTDAAFSYPPSSGGGGAATLIYKDSSGSSATTATIDYGTRTYGAGCSAIEIAVLWYNSAATDTITGITVGGSAAAQVAGVYGANSNGEISQDLWQFNSPVGTSADIQVTYSHAPTFSSGIAVYCLTTTTTTASAHTHTNTGNTPAASATMTVPSSGVGLAFAASNAGQVITWTNATSDHILTTGGAQFNFAHTTATGSVTVTATTASDVVGLGAAAWEP